MSNPFQEGAAYLLGECFEGIPPGKSGTWFVEGKEGILNGLNEVDAARASIKPTERCSSIAAHAYHILYAMRWANSWHGGPEPEGSWNDSWKKQDVTSQEWEELKAEVKRQYEEYAAWYNANENWSKEDIVVGSLAIVPHMAFHLGAIQQLVRIV